MRRLSFTSLLILLFIGIIVPLGFGFAVLVGPLVLAQGTTPTPHVTRVWPESGGRGQYITLEGSAFGYEIGRVYFLRRGEEVDASVDFPSQCQNYWWRDSYVVVRVPYSLEPGQYKMKVRRPDGVVSNETSFLVNNSTPTPGICAVITDNGPAGVPVKIYGANFGKSRGRVTIGNADLTIKDNDWSDSFISALTPLTGLQSGRLRVVDANKSLSNPAFFSVGRCVANSCGGGQTCCQDGTCRPSGQCEDRPRLCSYGWSFSTGALLGVGESCKDNAECSSNVCKDGKCARGDKTENMACRFDSECTQNLWCKAGICTSPYRLVGQACKDNAECASQSCVNNICAQGTKAIGAACTVGDQCVSKNCQKGMCTQSLREVKVDTIAPSGTNAPRNAIPSITFNQLIDTSTIPPCVTVNPSMNGTWAFYTIGAGEDAKTVAELRPKNTLSSSTNYNLTVANDCVKSLTPDAPSNQSGTNGGFTSGTRNAPIDSLRLFIDGVEKPRDLFTSTTASHVYRLEMLAGVNKINPDDSSIRVDWNVSPAMVAFRESTAAKKDERIVTPLSRVGEAIVTITVTQVYQEGTTTRTNVRTKSFYIQNDFCQNVWEYRDTTYQFDWSYCWDSGTAGSVKLPVLKQEPQKVSREGLFEAEYLFTFQDTGDPKAIPNNDAISVRVIPNTEHYSPRLWYKLKGPNTGNPQYALIDNFQGITDEAGGTYVSAVRGDGKSYIFFITANREASEETRTILNQLFKRIHIANHVSDPSSADSLRRDVLRLGDINDIADWLKGYAELQCQENNNGVTCDSTKAREYPKLEAGSYIPGQTISGWPSWQGTLGNLLGAALPSDPYPGSSGVGCITGSDGKRSCVCDALKSSSGMSYDPVTCFASGASKPFYFDSTKNALNNDKVHAYSYTAGTNGTSFELCARVERSSQLSLSGNLYCKGP